MLKVGIIGSGFGLYGLLPAFNSLKNCKIIAICGKRTDRLLSYCKKIHLENIYADWSEMLQKEQPDAIAIAVTPQAQYEIAKTAIKKGIHIFAEKPLALNYTQARELLNLARKYKIIHAVDFIFPEINEWKTVKQLIDNESYGKLKHISVNWDFLSYSIKNHKVSWKTEVTQGGGALSFYFSHSLYYLEYFAGKIISIQSILSYPRERKNGSDVGVDLSLEFQNGIKGYAHLNCEAKGLNRHQLIFQCEKGTIILENQNSITSNFIITIYTDEGVKKLSVPKEKIIKGEDERVEIVKKLAYRFVENCIQKKLMIPSFKEGARVQWLIEKIRLKS